MAFSYDFTMFDTTDPKLSKSADSLDSALAQRKNAFPSSNLNSIDNLLNTASSVSNNGAGFDELWLGSDFQLGVLSNEDIASLSSSPYSVLDDSPILGFENFGSSVGPSLFDINLGVNSDLSVSLGQTPANQNSDVITTAAVQQAAAALNIPWSQDLELQVLARARVAALVSSSNSTVIPKVEVVEQTPIVSPVVDVSHDVSKKRSLTPDVEHDEIIAKRAKNTDAARRSRLKKVMRLETLESKVSELETTNNRLTMKVAILETEKNGHLVKDAEQSARIAQLEAKLAEAHALLTSRA
ncbi:hypothetical protein BGZ76_004731 [Entomortierella beljakovae]|nr:hypothetical protein BGZ76_004731 [Entomortierella beljakovae]